MAQEVCREVKQGLPRYGWGCEWPKQLLAGQVIQLAYIRASLCGSRLGSVQHHMHMQCLTIKHSIRYFLSHLTSF